VRVDRHPSNPTLKSKTRLCWSGPLESKLSEGSRTESTCVETFHEAGNLSWVTTCAVTRLVAVGFHFTESDLPLFPGGKRFGSSPFVKCALQREPRYKFSTSLSACQGVLPMFMMRLRHRHVIHSLFARTTRSKPPVVHIPKPKGIEFRNVSSQSNTESLTSICVAQLGGSQPKTPDWPMSIMR
jgi:hypothetical protein